MSNNRDPASSPNSTIPPTTMRMRARFDSPGAPAGDVVTMEPHSKSFAQPSQPRLGTQRVDTGELKVVGPGVPSQRENGTGSGGDRSDGGGDGWSDGGVEDAGHDEGWIELLGGDHVRDRVRRGDQHGVGDVVRSGVEQAAEESGERQR